MTDSQKQSLYRCGLLVLLVAAVYGITLKHGFVWDDTYIIVNNPLLEKLGNIPRFFLSEDTIEESTGYYRPVTYISFALERALWGLNPFGYHLTNLILHMLAVLLFNRVVAKLFQKEKLAFVAALIFALHPLAGETVNFLSGGRNTLLSACFALLSLLFYARRKLIPAVISFTVAIFSKEFALLLPLVFLIYDWRLQRDKVRYGRYAIFVLPVLCYLILRSVAVEKANFLSAINLSDVATAPYLVVRYALNMIAPLQLKVLYDVKPNMMAGSLCFGVAVIMMAAGYYFRKQNEILFASCWFFLFLLPVINIIPLHTTTVLADRYAYFSLMGFAIGLAAVICKANRQARIGGVVMLCAIYSVIDVGRNGAWKSDIEFFTRMTQDAPEKFAGFKNLGMSYYRNGDITRAVPNLEAADKSPDITVKYLIGDAYVFWKEDMPDKAEKALVRAVELEPYNPEPYLILLMINEQLGNTATAQLNRNKLKEMGYNIDKIMTDRPVELCRTAESYMSKRHYADAEIYLWQALKINPAYTPALIDAGSLRAEQGDYVSAIQFFGKALTLDPSNASAHYNLALVYQMQGRTAEAQAEMNRFREAEALAKRTGSPAGP